MPNDFSIPTTISAEARLALSAFALKFRNFELPEPDDAEGWKSIHATFEERFAAVNAKIVENYAPTIQERELGGVPCLDIRPRDWQKDSRVAVYVHGGGFALFSAASTLTAAVPVAADSGIRVVSVDYTVAPHAQWQEITDQVVAVIEALVSEGHALEKIAIFGDSAGGAIAAGSVLKMRDERRGMPGAVVLWSPWSDISAAGDTYDTLKDADPILFWPKNLEHCAGVYASPDDQQNPYVSPVFGDYTLGFPPTLIQCGTKEIFVSDAVRHYRALERAQAQGTDGVLVTLDPYEGMWHVFQSFHPELPESKLARSKMAGFLASHL